MALLSALKQLHAAGSFEEAFEAQDITTPEMQRSISESFALYFRAQPDERADPSQRTPVVIVDGFCRAVFGEYKASLDKSAPDTLPLETTLQNLDRVREEAFQLALVGGEGFLKPVMRRGAFVFNFISRRNMLVFGRDTQGAITDLGTVETVPKNQAGNVFYYHLLERRRVDENGYLTIENRLYRSKDRSSAGKEVPLTEIPEFAQLRGATTYHTPLDGLGLIPIKTPVSNCVDGSRDGASIFASAVGEIKKLYRHERRIENEYELTEPHLVTSCDIQRRDETGKMVDLPKYITAAVDADPGDVGMTIYNPAPNQVQLEARENQKLRNIEDLLNMYRGFLSHVENVERTATEVESSKSKGAHTIASLQKMWESAVRETLRVCGLLAAVYFSQEWPAAELTVSWGNGILYDEETEYRRLSAQVAAGNLLPEYLLDWLKLQPLHEERLLELRKLMPERADTRDFEEG